MFFKFIIIFYIFPQIIGGNSTKIGGDEGI